ncbi:MAG: hypothetical protein ACI80V_002863 [Rhodothermales bacterium]|jgi:hypothetical protein
MNKSMRAILIAWIALLYTAPVTAQVPVLATNPIQEYIADAEASRSGVWWGALSAQLNLEAERPVEDVDQATLQNIIFFATHHRDRLDIRSAATALTEVYRAHPEPAFRMMALAALNAIGDTAGMEEVLRSYREQSSETVRNMSVAALREHQLIR